MNWARKKGTVLINGNKKAKQKEKKEYSQGVKGRQVYPYSGVLGGCVKCLAILAELAVQHCLGVSQQSGQDFPRGHLQHL